MIEPSYEAWDNGRPPVGLEACEDALYDSAVFRSLAGFDLGERVPDATTSLKFRRLPEQHRPGEALMARVRTR